MAQQAFGRHDNKGLAKPRFNLAPQQMKILGRCGRIAYLEVVIGTQQQKPLKPGTGVLRPHAFITVGQQQNQAAETLPLGLTAGNKQVNHRLGIIDEIAELGLPENQAVGLSQRIAVFKTECAGLRQKAVINIKPGLIGINCI